MRYMILIYGNVAAWNAMRADSFGTLMAAHHALVEELKALGEFVETNELPIEDSRTVRMRGGQSEVTDGPFVEIKEIVAGYYIVECDSVDRATAIAARLAEAEFGLVEVRRLTAQPSH